MAFAQKFIVADDHPLFRAALNQALRQVAPQAEIVEADTMEATTDMVLRHPDADLILLDLHMPGAHGFSGLIQLRGQSPEVPVVVISGSEEPPVVRRAIDYGASGFIPKSSSLDVIAEAIRQVLEGEVWLPEEMVDILGESNEEEARFAEAIASLTPQQFRVLNMLNEGLLNKQIAYELNVSEATIKAHVTAILRKLGVHSRTQAVIAAQKLEVEPPKVES
ncbi:MULTISPECIES: response regulator [Chromohalobacter]|jgi:DNA-binding NarL/FixJ family response regulator|uniref:Two component transcriptional regulator, LuxR family n=1 Tax=Chromohalobacter israelensis (strain ATCC BAA-138 / DSM 3043 / CIP 106854 / NCIMB 13768 / 1H11) TaxID=290398 RepID=Q1QZ85_CHRI1|nr:MULTISPECIES: response regulator transcription factor [Chromohalobacter]ABE58223.1 two component transcriptional regulator, LuxR family [Chromohalobacter salexigens DSM 3043]MBZ5875713.1 response regulator transcription factor [Chromohalobacter salexigens]MDF9433330.1 response regulator transcription factor [Chromohalobacter israelensis]MDO0944298.1 response regulator transcription factor [Chromohalobacter salexigens]NQY45876.1 response regulator transcription factor [Chromohalobacter sp.]